MDQVAALEILFIADMILSMFINHGLRKDIKEVKEAHNQLCEDMGLDIHKTK